MSVALKIVNLNKNFGKRKILHDVSLEVNSGEVFGFLGPNGAGKTTTIKIAVGLLNQYEGDVFIDGYCIKKDYEKALANVGGIVENPELYKHLTGMQNLMQYARMREGINKERVNEVVELVGLSKRINDKVSKYSLGMRQRLGVAQSILHKPKLLILDEPTNGLDPAGIKELRDLMIKLAHEEGIGVLVSSHLMSEMEMLCDRIGIITDGKLMAVHTIDELTSTSEANKTEYTIMVDNSTKAIEVIQNLEYKVTEIDDRTIKVVLDSETADDEISKINSTIISSNIKLYTVNATEHKRLEDVFIELTQSGGKQIG